MEKKLAEKMSSYCETEKITSPELCDLPGPGFSVASCNACGKLMLSFSAPTR